MNDDRLTADAQREHPAAGCAHESRIERLPGALDRARAFQGRAAIGRDHGRGGVGGRRVTDEHSVASIDDTEAAGVAARTSRDPGQGIADGTRLSHDGSPGLAVHGGINHIWRVAASATSRGPLHPGARWPGALDPGPSVETRLAASHLQDLGPGLAAVLAAVYDPRRSGQPSVGRVAETHRLRIARTFQVCPRAATIIRDDHGAAANWDQDAVHD